MIPQIGSEISYVKSAIDWNGMERDKSMDELWLRVCLSRLYDSESLYVQHGKRAGEKLLRCRSLHFIAFSILIGTVLVKRRGGTAFAIKKPVIETLSKSILAKTSRSYESWGIRRKASNASLP